MFLSQVRLFFRMRRICLEMLLWSNPLGSEGAPTRSLSPVSFVIIEQLLSSHQTFKKKTLKRLLLAIKMVFLKTWILGCFCTKFQHIDLWVNSYLRLSVAPYLSLIKLEFQRSQSSRACFLRERKLFLSHNSRAISAFDVYRTFLASVKYTLNIAFATC